MAHTVLFPRCFVDVALGFPSDWLTFWHSTVEFNQLFKCFKIKIYTKYFDISCFIFEIYISQFENI